MHRNVLKRNLVRYGWVFKVRGWRRTKRAGPSLRAPPIKGSCTGQESRAAWLVLPCRWSRRRGLNPQPADYKSAALPLSYTGLCSLQTEVAEWDLPVILQTITSTTSGTWWRLTCFIVVRTNGIVQDYIWIWHILFLIRKLCVCPCKCHLNAFFSVLSQLVLQWEWVFGLHPDHV